MSGNDIKSLNRQQVSTILSAVACGDSGFSQAQSSMINDQNTGFFVDASHAFALPSQHKL
jgi:hypothetical protein